ncbi:nitroreductase family deazaflavin-dependent oxidoreductase [Streptomyces sp. NPDC001401]|uniref:nitroreductase family deazaflavin-dependent oxidoreductase n=1 Tax=Streptomyces sp. NPDC001401 TaxID=3364570 RepID=UPI00368E5D43
MPFPRVLAHRTRGRINRTTLRFAGRLAFADLEHVGRSSGTVRHTPLRAFRAGDKVVIGINFGRESDWLKNIQAAGRCRMRLGGERLELGAPTIVPVEEGVRGMPWLFGAALKYVVRTTECVELPVLGSRPANGPPGP